MLSTVVVLAVTCAWPVLFAFEIPDSCELNTLYQELNCTPIYEGGSKCPVAYDCDNYKKLDPKKCYFAGKTYAKGEELKDKDSPDACLHCTCGDAYPDKENAVWHCAMPQCAGHVREPGCVELYTTLNACCSKGVYCENTDPKPNITCNYKGHIYVGGQLIYDTDTCKKSICDANFKDTLKGSTCQYQSCCHTFPPSDKYLKDGCVPVYPETAHCNCPVEHKCPEITDAIAPLIDSDSVLQANGSNITATQSTGSLNSTEFNATVAHPTENLHSVPKSIEPTYFVEQPMGNSIAIPESRRQCKFGDLKLYVGEKLIKKEKESFECSCEAPPFITCIQN